MPQIRLVLIALKREAFDEHPSIALRCRCRFHTILFSKDKRATYSSFHTALVLTQVQPPAASETHIQSGTMKKVNNETGHF